MLSSVEAGGNFHIMFAASGHLSQTQVEVWTLEILLAHNRRKIDECLRKRPDLKPLVDVALGYDKC